MSKRGVCLQHRAIGSARLPSPHRPARYLARRRTGGPRCTSWRQHIGLPDALINRTAASAADSCAQEFIGPPDTRDAPFAASALVIARVLGIIAA